jgi:hypothetical protein
MNKIMVSVAAAGAALVLAACGGSGVPSVIHGTITATMLSVLSGAGGASNCILNLPGQGSEITLKADGVAVGTAQLGKGGFHIKKIAGEGEICSETFTIPNVPGGKSSYSITINADNSTTLGSYGCHGTIYYKPSRLSKPLQLSCS